MNQAEIRNYIENYFKAFESEFVESNDAYFSVELPIEVDKDLGNRPFYWTYVEKIGIPHNPLTLTFIFDREQTPEEIRGEELPFGSRRLHQIFESAKKHGKFARLYETPPNIPTGSLPSFPLTPWLCVNYKIEFICDQKRDLLLPLGINLISGQIVKDFYNQVNSLPLTPKLPNYTFTMQPIFGLESAANRLEQYIQSIVDKEDDEWAKQASRRLEEEKQLIEAYYCEEVNQRAKQGEEEEAEQLRQQVQDEKEMRLKELIWQFEPRIQVTALNTGLFYLRSQIE
ncbi:hypothetical protein BEP19_00880 [Ammoniphilus oxalaticus]|uniref:YqhG n=1 Tax=Ammoniphilus oxalaticus TaxID=66863 RepID=A0A419SMV0_9BACL|nr:YqhG family protein [Ammoniphilus oxalaticus]RKD25531.1 hypothetical protein BEP19_00880 [Ammoniphilus oxalaticus]